MPGANKEATWTVRDEVDVRVLVVTGELEMATADAFATDGVHLVMNLPANAQLKMDLSGVTFIDSTGLRALLQIHSHAPDTVVLRNPSAPVQRLLDMTVGGLFAVE
jgi:anti-anti-sigma factor